MAWRNQGITGSNNIPLGNRRRFGGDDDNQSITPPPTTQSDQGNKRGRSPARNPDGTKQRKKRNRWGDAQENKAAGLMNLPTAIMASMTAEQLEAYTLHLRIEEISQKLRINDVVPADGDRSPSPPPQYDNHGRRVNTREFRYRKRLEEERHKLIEKAMKNIPDYRPPSDYRRPTKTQEKVYVPVNDYPEINFIGLLIGPRGNTLKKMEQDSGAKIAIRGKGSVKEGKGRSDAAHTSNQEEDLHCLIMADTEEKVNKAKQAIHLIIETAASIPEGQNELKRNQLRELAALNGTLRDDENQACQNCGAIGHRKLDCPEQRNFTANIICRVCGNSGHMARDCPDRQKGTNWNNDARGGFNGRPVAGRIENGPTSTYDSEYEKLMNELGGGTSSTDGPQQRIEAGPGSHDNAGDKFGNEQQQHLKPWQRGPTGAAAPWLQRNREDRDGGGGNGGPPPWASGGNRPGNDNHGYNNNNNNSNGFGSGGYGAGQGGSYGVAPGAAPWQQPSMPAAPGAGYPGYQYGGYGDQSTGYNSAGAPGYPAAPGFGQPTYGGGIPPPPPGSAPPPPPGDAPPPPPPPPSDGPPPPPPPPPA